MNAAAVPFWIEASVALLLTCSGAFALIGALGLVRLKHFFQRMHPPALAYTLGAWCVTLATVLFFSALESRPVLHPLLVVVLLAITMPVTTVLLARVALFRKRQDGADVPAPLEPRSRV